jgi:RNA polymerase sigma-70 factor, ECF subfamily
MSDADLVRQARAGRTEAYAELVQRWAGRITAICHARVRRAHVAEDLAQETLLRGFRALHTLSDPERFGAWLSGIAVRICLDHCKARKNAQVPFSALRDEHNPEKYLTRSDGDLTALEREEERQQLLAQVEALPEDYRQVVLLYYYNDVTYRDLANLLGVSPATINARLSRARALLRTRLSPCPR